MYFYALLCLGMSTRNRITRLVLRSAPITHSQNTLTLLRTQTHTEQFEFGSFSTVGFCYVWHIWLNAQWRVVKRATSLARLVYAGVLLFHHFLRNEIANKNNYVIEIGYKKWERLDFVENLYATIIFYGLYGAFTALLVSSFVPSLSA